MNASIFELFLEETRADARIIVLIAAIAGMANTMVMAIANHAVEDANADARHLLLFGLMVVAYAMCARRTHHRMSELAQAAHHRFKTRIINKIEQAEYAQIERLGISTVHERVSESGATITMAAGVFSNLLMSASILACTLIYIALVAKSAVLLVVLIFGVGVWLYWQRFKTVETRLKAASGARVAFFAALSDLLHGFKELKFSQRRGAEVVEEAVTTSAALRDLSIEAGEAFDSAFVFLNCVMFTALLAITFLFPALLGTTNEVVRHLVIAVIFVWGPFLGIAGGFPNLLRMRVAFELLQKIEGDIDALLDQLPERSEDPWAVTERFELELQALEFAYPRDEHSGREFAIGPIDLSVGAGEVVFVVGGNGSGKSTLFKVLTGLYPASGGQLLLGGVEVSPETLEAYRARLSVIFTDFHLFRRLHGLRDADQGEIDRLLALMKIEDKTQVRDGQFTTIELSTGQRKRVAMLVAMLEDRPICAFDEWAADQDPEFRQFFYEELIPMLTLRGKIVVAVTHDDRYFDCADKIVTMEDGRIRSIQFPRQPAPDESAS